MKASVVIFVASLIAGCAGVNTTPVRLADSIEVPENRRYDGYERYVVDRGEANVFIVRDKGFKASWDALPLYVNGHRVASLKNAESLSLKLPVGQNLLGITHAGYLSEKAERNGLSESVLNVAEGEVYYFRFGVLLYDGIVLQRSSQVR